MEYASIIGALIAFIVYLFIHLLEMKPVKIREVASSIGEAAGTVSTSVMYSVDGRTKTTKIVTREKVSTRMKSQREQLPDAAYHEGIDAEERRRRKEEDARRKAAEEALRKAVEDENEMRLKENRRRAKEQDRINKLYDECEALYEEEVITIKTITETQKGALKDIEDQGEVTVAKLKDEISKRKSDITSLQQAIMARRKKGENDLANAKNAFETARSQEGELRARFEAEMRALMDAEARRQDEENRRRSEAESKLQRMRDALAADRSAEEARRRALG
jgi:hypothetical protein